MTPSGKAEDANALGDEASGWLIALSEDPDDMEVRAAFEEWRSTSDAHAKIWEQTARTYDLFGKVEPGHKEDWAGYAEVRGQERAVLAIETPARRERPATRRARRRWPPVAAVAAVACLMLVLAPGLLVRVQSDYVTGTAELRSVRLADGSVVKLGPETAVRVAYEQGERRIDLLQGSAYFDVKPDTDRPFHVAAHDVGVTVLGTAFDVQIENGETDVSVERGHVRVDRQNGEPAISEHLHAGDRISIADGGRMTRGDLRTADVAAWSRGELIADRMSVEQVVDTLKPWYRGKIFLRGKDAARRTVTGIYDVRDPEAVLAALAKTHRLSIQHVTPWVIIVSAN